MLPRPLPLAKATLAQVGLFSSLFVFSGLARPTTVIADETQEKTEEAFHALFDGKSLKGWKGDPKYFRVEKGAIVAGSLEKKIPHNAFLVTEKEFGDFELRLQAKLTGVGKNAGVQFRTRQIPNHHEVSGYQCDMGQMSDGPIWGWLYDESRRRKFLATSDKNELKKVVRQDDWNDLVIRCRDNHIQIWVNGFQTVNYKEMNKDIDRTGIIALQIHSGPPAEASYRRIRIKEIVQK